MRVLTEDMWNHKAKHERTRLWRMYCSPQIKAYTPDGGESTGYEEVRLALSRLHSTKSFCTRHHLIPTPPTTDTNPQCDSYYDGLRADNNRRDWKFELTGELYLIGNTFMQTWFFGKGVEGVEGWSVITVNSRGEVISLHGVVEDARNPSVQQEDEPTNPPPVVALGCWRTASSSPMDGIGGFEAPGRISAV